MLNLEHLQHLDIIVLLEHLDLVQQLLGHKQGQSVQAQHIKEVLQQEVLQHTQGLHLQVQVDQHLHTKDLQVLQEVQVLIQDRQVQVHQVGVIQLLPEVQVLIQDRQVQVHQVGVVAEVQQEVQAQAHQEARVVEDNIFRTYIIIP